MKLKILGSSSLGNGYILENDAEALVIECGVKLSLAKKALDFNLSKVVAALISHEHGDHAGCADDYLKACIPVFCSRGTGEALKIKGVRRPHVCRAREPFTAGGFTITPFDVQHDAAEPLGFVIHHPETGNILFATDTYYLKYRFADLHNIMIEANYCLEILNRNMSEGRLSPIVRDRVIESHMSLATCIETLQANDLSQVNNTVLLHLSDGNSDARLFQSEVQQACGKPVFIAEKDLDLDFNKTAF
jgi:phosphoribosyl 1,2-cyclic phosphodiesterase